MFPQRRTWLSIAIFIAPAVFGANQCVNPGGRNGCSASINAAIAAAGPNDTVTVAQDLEKLQDWIGERETDVDYVTIPAVHRLAATLDRDDPVPKFGDPLRVGDEVKARNVRPLFADQPFTLCGEPSDDGKRAKLWTMDATGALATNASAEFY